MIEKIAFLKRDWPNYAAISKG